MLNMPALHSATLTEIQDFLIQLLQKQASASAIDWLQGQLVQAQSGQNVAKFYMAFSGVNRHFSKETVSLATEEVEQAGRLCRGWEPGYWNQQTTARTALLLVWPSKDASAYSETLFRLFDTAEMGELVALYSALAVLPHPEMHILRAAEGVRTNMTNVFDAVALHNPYAAIYFSDEQWNQMILKAAFSNRPLTDITGLDHRANPALARILSDFAHERWAAGRYVSPELWRPVAPFLDGTLWPDIERLYADAEEIHRQAGALASYHSQYPPAKNQLNQHPDLLNAIEQGSLTWDTIAAAWNQ